MLADDELKDACLLVSENKQDLPGALTPAEITDSLELNTLNDRSWYVQGTWATQGMDYMKDLIGSQRMFKNQRIVIITPYHD